MSALDLLDILVHVVFILVGILALADFLRHRDPVRRDVAALFSILAIPFVIQLAATIQGVPVSSNGSIISILALVFEPLLLLRVVRYLRSMPSYMLRLGLFTLVLTLVEGIFIGQKIPALTTIISQGYLIGINLYAMVGFVRGVRRSAGIRQQRQRLAAAGTGFFAVIFALVVLANSLPPLQGLFFGLAEVSAIACLISFYGGFIPPRWLRRIWQLSEFGEYLRQLSAKPVNRGLDADEIMSDLCGAASRAVGATSVGIVRRDAVTQQLQLAYSDDLAPMPWPDAPVLSSAWSGTEPVYVRALAHPDPEDRRLLDTTQAGTLLLSPIVTRGGTWGLLVVALKYNSLFIEDDLYFLKLLCEQSAIFLEHGALVANLQDNSARLEQTLRLTQTLYETSSALLGTKGFAEILDAIQGGADAASLLSLELDATGRPGWATVIGRSGQTALSGQPLGSRYSLPNLGALSDWVKTPSDILLVQDVTSEPRFSDSERQMARRAGYGAFVAMPLTISSTWLGALMLYWAEPHTFAAGDRQFYRALAALVTTAMESERLRLAEEQGVQKLTQQEARLRLMADNVGDMISRHAADGTMTYVSPSSSALMGYAPEELTGRGIEQWIYPDDVWAARRVFSGDLDTTKDGAVAYRIRHREGSIRWVETTGRSLHDPSGALEVVAATRDISRRREAEEAVQQLNLQLEQRATQLAAANQELEAFSYSVSHDLRSPLRALNGWSQALEEDYADKFDADGKNYLQRIRTASVRMGQLIDDLLQLSQLSRSEMRRSNVNLSEMARQIGGELNERHPDYAVEFSVEDGVTVNGDSRLLQAMMTNLLDNAWKYSSKTANARVEFASAPHNGSRACFVRDNGAGFDMAYANKLFGAFQRLHGQEFEGTGIGLATVQRIVQRHGGEIWAEAAVGQGATFYFTLDAAQAVD